MKENETKKTLELDNAPFGHERNRHLRKINNVANVTFIVVGKKSKIIHTWLHCFGQEGGTRSSKKMANYGWFTYLMFCGNRPRPPAGKSSPPRQARGMLSQVTTRTGDVCKFHGRHWTR